MRRGLTAHLIALAVAVTLGTAAHAANLPSRFPPASVMAAAPVFIWAGFYTGVNAGYGWNTIDDNMVINGRVYEVNDEDGLVGGGQIGYNYQIDFFVLGLEADIQYADIGSGNYIPGLNSDDDDNWFGTIRARARYAFNHALIYATGGLIYGKISNGFSNSDDTSDEGTLGACVKYAFADNLRAEFEALNVNLDQDDADDNLPAITGSGETEFVVTRAGLNYKFSTY